MEPLLLDAAAAPGEFCAAALATMQAKARNNGTCHMRNVRFFMVCTISFPILPTSCRRNPSQRPLGHTIGVDGISW
jgi:hypothetical protein